MARSVPTINGTPSFKRVSVGYVDASGDQRSTSLIAGPAVSDAQVEAMVDAIADYTNAVVWSTEITDVYQGSSSKSLAVDDTYPSVYDNIVILYRNATTRKTQDAFVPAPVPVLFNPGTDDPNTDPTGDLAVLASVIANVIGSASYEAISARFTERREINQRQKF